MKFSRLLTQSSVAVLAAVSMSSVALAQDKSNWPKSLTLGTASVGGVYFVYGGVAANIMSEKTGVNVSTQQTQGPNQNMILVDGNNIDLGMVTMGVAYNGWNGKGWANGKKHQNVRAMFPMYDTPFACVTNQSSGIKSFSDLNGKNVGVGPRAGTPGTYFPIFFDALGMKVTVRNGGASDMAGQLGDGLIDAFCFAAGQPIPAFSEIEAQRPVTLFGFTDDEIAKIRQAAPEVVSTVIPKGTYRTQAEDMSTVGLFNFAVANKDLPDSLVYELTKAVMENNAAMVQGHAAAKETIPQNAAKNDFFTFHPGAVKYFQEKGIQLNPGAM
ncbi:MAG: TAXI family TRAP transporter solute-binding subunit [Burkholderiaceae bacterium]|nr:TAXI family TRAP transporter solute-binding subunit [Burkholderiaceae bacterium]